MTISKNIFGPKGLKVVSLILSVISAMLFLVHPGLAKISFLVALTAYVAFSRYVLKSVWNRKITWWQDNSDIEGCNTIQSTILIMAILMIGFSSSDVPAGKESVLLMAISLVSLVVCWRCARNALKTAYEAELEFIEEKRAIEEAIAEKNRKYPSMTEQLIRDGVLYKWNGILLVR